MAWRTCPATAGNTKSTPPSRPRSFSCLWGMASGIGFGVAEGVMYSVRYYNGIAGFDAYLTRFAACVGLHAVWSASVGITLFQARRTVSKAVNAILYCDFKGQQFDWEQ